ncbi:MAG: LPS export ABC transporter permease LptG [Xanthobacteraceae bacterium]
MPFPSTLQRYFGMRFLSATLTIFVGVFLLVAMVDYVELVRRTSDVPDISGWMVVKASLFRIPQITEKIMPFCVLIGAIACFLNLSRRLELVVVRAAGMSAWQFIAPPLAVAFLLGAAATTIYNPVSALLLEHSKRLQVDLLGKKPPDTRGVSASGFWVRQRGADGQSIVNALSSQEQGVRLGGVTVFKFDASGQFMERVEAKSAVLEPGYWRLEEARIYASGNPASEFRTYSLNTTLTPEQVRESFATPESVPFWSLPLYIEIADNAGLGAAGYRVQYHKLLALPFLFMAMVLLAAAVSLHFFRFGGVQKMVLGGVAAGFLLYVLSKGFEDFSRAGLLNPAAAAWLPVLLGVFAGVLTLLYQEDG